MTTNNDKAIEYLEQIEVCDVKITNKLLEKEQWLALATKVNCSTEGERVQSSSNPEKVADAVIKMVEIDKEIDKLIDDYVELKQEVIDTIHQLTDAKLINVLYMKYVQYESLYSVAHELHYSYQWVLKLHKRGLAEIQKSIS